MIFSASSTEEWSFHSQARALGLPANCGSEANGVPSRSSGSGVEPVVSTPMPMMRSGQKCGSSAAAFSAPITHTSSPST